MVRLAVQGHRRCRCHGFSEAGEVTALRGGWQRAEVEVLSAQTPWTVSDVQGTEGPKPTPCGLLPERRRY
ncbi:hypothetical protein chiPu_0027154, partial [Chiloscyllium punctatum]|nr:hypothetical protein [Chiloscyllium punctatum]